MLNNTIGELLKRNSKNHGEKEAVVFSYNNIRWTWNEFDRLSDLVAKSLLAQGIKRGDHVAIWGTNRPQWLLTQMGSAKIGAALVTINPEWKSNELEYALNQSDTKLLVMIDGFSKMSGNKEFRYDYIKTIREIVPELSQVSSNDNLNSQKLPELKKVVLVCENSEKGMINWEDFLRLGEGISNEKFEEVFKSVDKQDTCLIQYTSGTTGFPKGAQLTHFNVANNAFQSAQTMKLTDQDSLCGPVPFYHCFGSILVNLIGLTVPCKTVIPAEHFNPRSTLEAVSKEKCTALHGVPTMFITELDDPDFQKFDTSHLRTGIMAGAPCPAELMDAVAKKMGAKDITIGYGLTEASPITHQTCPEDTFEKRITTVGRPHPNTEARIVDPGTMKDSPQGEVGEIWVRGYNVMKGYYKKPEETTKSIVDGGWLRTGDLGFVDDEGYFHISGRLKEMFIVGGHNVYPAEIEQTIQSMFHDKIDMIQVVGVPHPKLQEACACAVQVKPGVKLTEEEIIEKCKAEMEWPKVPRYVKFMKDYSQVMTVTGKIQKFKLKDIFVEEFNL